jgi:hypothetical protein
VSALFAPRKLIYFLTYKTKASSTKRLQQRIFNNRQVVRTACFTLHVYICFDSKEEMNRRGGNFRPIRCEN